MNIEAIVKTVESVDSTTILVGMGMAGAIAMAFTKKVRLAIKERANGYDEFTGEYIGDTGECIHLDHNKQSPDYNDPNNGLYGSQTTHFWAHGIDEDNGLNSHQNAWARRMISSRAKPTEEQKKIFGRWVSFDSDIDER